MEDSQLSKILFVERDSEYLDNIRMQLTGYFDFYSAANSEQALEMVQDNGPFEAVVTAADIENVSGLELLDRIQQLSPATIRILLTAEDNLPCAEQALDQGRIFSYLLKSSSSDEIISFLQNAVLENTRSLHHKQLEQEAEGFLSNSERLRPAAMFDPELGIGSPEAMELELEHTHDTSVRYKRPYSIAIFDIDGYETYAEHYGRKAAKLAHKLAAEHIRHSCRSADRIYRCNADTSILLILPETLYEGAGILANRVILSFAARNIPNSKSKEHGLLTLSGSMASYDPENPDQYGSWLNLMDEAYLYLHVAQGQGGNIVGKPLAWMNVDEFEEKF